MITSGTALRRIDVIYICSNLAIAKQNVRRLNLSGDPDVASADRITMLPAKISELAANKVNFISFTPTVPITNSQRRKHPLVSVRISGHDASPALPFRASF